MTQRKVVTALAPEIASRKVRNGITLRNTLMTQTNLVPVAPEEDAIPLSEQREKKLGPDYNPDYFASIDSLIEDAYGPATGDFKSISGR